MAITDDMKAYWNFEEASGNLIDVHTGTHTLTETGGTIASAGGKVGNCRDFELDDSEWFQRSAHADLANIDEDMTIAFWVNLESKATYQDIITYGWNVGSSVYGCEYRTNTDRFRFYMCGDANFVNQTVIAADNFGSPTLGTWYFYVAWHDAANNEIGIQINNGTANTTAHTTGGWDQTLGIFVIGAGYNWNPMGQFFDGMLDECGFWKRVLTADEKTWLYNSGNGRTYADMNPKTFTGTSSLNG